MVRISSHAINQSVPMLCVWRTVPAASNYKLVTSTFCGGSDILFIQESVLGSCLFYSKPRVQLCIDPVVANSLHELIKADCDEQPPTVSKVIYQTAMPVSSIHKLRFSLFVLEDPFNQTEDLKEEVTRLLEQVKDLKIPDDEVINFGWFHPTM